MSGLTLKTFITKNGERLKKSCLKEYMKLICKLLCVSDNIDDHTEEQFIEYAKLAWLKMDADGIIAQTDNYLFDMEGKTTISGNISAIARVICINYR